MTWILYVLFVPYDKVQKNIVIEEGIGLRQISSYLREEGVIKNSTVFTLYVLAVGVDRDLKAGEYAIQPGTRIIDLTDIMARGLVVSDEIEILMPEGFNIWEIDKRLTDHDLIKEGDFSSKYYTSEGYFFPDTYRFNKHKKESVEEIAAKMRKPWQDNIMPLVASLSQDRQREVIVIASILEKEARAEKDTQIVSGIIQQRLARGMKLEVDASVSYGACLRLFIQSGLSENCAVNRIPVALEIRIDSVYNTYTRPGLPPKPIANPGVQSIKAALNPIETAYLYYLTTRDGQMIYSKTGAEHVANRRKYLGL